jgi:2-phosphosulfolactate phosphatase
MKKSFIIDYLPESARRYREGWAVVAVDVIRATTMAITAVSLGRRCYPVSDLEAASRLALQLKHPLLAGEINGDMPAGFEMNNSPALLAERDDIARPLIMLSSSGTRLITNGRGCDALYLGCFRNSKALGLRLAHGDHNRIALIGAGSQNEFRQEDQIGCAWIAAELIREDYAPEDKQTAEILQRWANADATDCLNSKSVDYLRRTNQLRDLYFILDKVNDVSETFVLEKQQIVVAPELSTSRQRDGVVAC